MSYALKSVTQEVLQGIHLTLVSLKSTSNDHLSSLQSSRPRDQFNIYIRMCDQANITR